MVTALHEAREKKAATALIHRAEASLNAALAEARLLGSVTICKVRNRTCSAVRRLLVSHGGCHC